MTTGKRQTHVHVTITSLALAVTLVGTCMNICQIMLYIDATEITVIANMEQVLPEPSALLDKPIDVK